MNEQPFEVTPRRDWRRLARKWWPAAAAAVAAIVVIIVMAGGGDGESPAAVVTDSSAAEHADEDSVVTLDSTTLRNAGIEAVTPAVVMVDELLANGTITYDADQVSIVAPRAESRVASVRVDLGQQVRAGDVLALLESGDVGRLRGALQRARASLDVTRRNYEREKRLFEQSITSQKELLEAESAFRSAQADVDAAAAELSAVGAGDGNGAVFGLASPISGTVVERNANPGQIVGPTAALFTVANLGQVWITVDVYEADLARVRRGAVAVVMPSALPGEQFRGRVTFAGGVVDPGSRTFKLRVELENPALRLRPGMFAQVRIAAAPTGARVSGELTVPEIAVQEVNGKQVVFVISISPGRFIARPVILGPRLQNGQVTITSGLTPGEMVVGRGAFQLKAEMMKSSFGEGH